MNTLDRLTQVVLCVAFALNITACKLTRDTPTGHCMTGFSHRSEMERDLRRLSAEQASHSQYLKENPQVASTILKSFLLHYEILLGPLLTDQLLAAHGLPAFEPPKSMEGAAAQMRVLELVTPLIMASLSTHEAECIEATERHEESAICREMRRDFDSFSRLCSRVTDLLLRFEAGEWTASGLDSLVKRTLMQLFKQDLARRRADVTVTRVHPELSKFTRFQTAWHYDDFSNQEFSKAYREALQRLVLVVSMAGAVAPSDCGPIAVQCMR